MLAMRVHRTICSGHRPPSSPRPMADPADRHRPSPERSGRRLRGPPAAPPRRVLSGPRARPAGQMCGPDVAPARQRGGALEAGEARGGPRRPRGAAQEAGSRSRSGSCSRPGRVRARGCRRSRRASDSLNFTRRCGGEQETPRQQLGRTSRRPRAFSLSSLPALALSPSCQSRPLGQPLLGPWQTFSCPSPPAGVLPPSIYCGVTKCTRFTK